MTPKPPIIPHAQPKRLPKRTAVTIAAGFVCRDGVVICADTQETYGNLLKISVPKITIRPGARVPGQPRMVMAGAGDGPFIDKLADEAWKNVTRAGVTELDAVADAIETAIKNTYEEFGRIYQAGAMPTAELIYGVVGSTRLPSLFRASGPVVNSIPTYASIGVGLYMADYIADRMGHASMMDSGWAELLGIYLLQQAKDYIDGCGGESHVVTLHGNGTVTRLDHADVLLIGGHMKRLDQQTSAVLLSAPDLDLSDEEFRKRVEIFTTFVEEMRQEHRRQKTEIDAIRSKDPLRKWVTKVQKEDDSA